MVAQSDVAGGAVLSSAVVSKLFWRIIPLLFLLVMLNYIDRSNLSVAQLQMQGELHFTDEIIGFGVGIFFSRLLSARKFPAPC